MSAQPIQSDIKRSAGPICGTFSDEDLSAPPAPKLVKPALDLTARRERLAELRVEIDAVLNELSPQTQDLLTRVEEISRLVNTPAIRIPDQQQEKP